MSEHTITVKGEETFKAAAGTKLVKAIEGQGIDISHRCGGNARCTTCRVKITGPEPRMGDAEKQCLDEDGVLGEFRLSCQIRIDQDLTVEVLQRASVMGWEPGPEVEA